MARILIRLTAVLLCCASPLLLAGTFYDPTRPPPAFMPSASQSAASAPVEKPLVLQSVLLSPQRKLALISGQSLKIGQSIRGYQLQSLSNSEARLLGPNGILVLKLLSAQARDMEPGSSVPGQTLRGEPK